MCAGSCFLGLPLFLFILVSVSSLPADPPPQLKVKTLPQLTTGDSSETMAAVLLFSSMNTKSKPLSKKKKTDNIYINIKEFVLAYSKSKRREEVEELWRNSEPRTEPERKICSVSDIVQSSALHVITEKYIFNSFYFIINLFLCIFIYEKINIKRFYFYVIFGI